MILRRIIEHVKAQNWTAVALDFVIVVTGVFIGVQATGWSGERAEQRQIRSYLQSLKEDLAAERDMLAVVTEQINETIEEARTLADYSRGRTFEAHDNLDILALSPLSTYRPYEWNRTTFSQLKAIGAVRQVKSARLRKLIAEYEALTDHLDLDFETDQRRYELVTELSFGVLDYNYADLRAVRSGAKSGAEAAHSSAAYTTARSADASLLARDLRDIKSYISAYLALGDMLRPRTASEIPKLIEIGREIEELIDEDY